MIKFDYYDSARGGADIAILLSPSGERGIEGTDWVIYNDPDSHFVKNGKWSYQPKILKSKIGFKAVIQKWTTHSPYVHVYLVDVENPENEEFLFSGKRRELQAMPILSCDKKFHTAIEVWIKEKAQFISVPSELV